ncbi:hypothetical protein [Achromobacter insuavis]|uniref:hypothetical protein n=1 Tax=Achromobacter insuavis TaxID=1287735 RepID=UPI0035A10875
MSKTDNATAADRQDRRASPDAAGRSADQGEGKANTPHSDTDAAHRSGQFGADKPDAGKTPAPRRGADKRPHPQGPEYEEGGQYPGTREPGARR